MDQEIAWLREHAGALVLVLARVLGMAWTAPALGAPGFDPRIRVLLAGLLGAVVLPVVGPSIKAPEGWDALPRLVLAEGLVGAALGWSAGLVIAGARQAGEVVGAQSGLSPAALLDPDAGDELTPLGHLYGLVALAIFLTLDGPLMLVQALVESYRVLPAGDLALSLEAVDASFGRVGQALVLALRAAAPVALALALAGVALGLLGRAAPALPLMALSLPARTAVGLVLVLLGLVTLAATLSAAWSASLW